MTLLFCDGFDHYNNILEKWNVKGGTEATVLFSTIARTGSALQIKDRTWVRKVVGSPVQELIVGAALKFEDNNFRFLAVQYLGSTQVELYLNSDNTISIRQGNGTILATSTSAVNQNIWNFVELYAKIDNTSGCAVLRVNGETWASASGVDTQYANGPYANDILFEHQAANLKSLYVDDVYVVDPLAGSVNNTFLGDVTVEALFPSGIGTYSQWSPSPAGDNYANVDEYPHDSDTTYVSASVSGTRDTYQFQDLSVASASIFGVALWPILKKDLSGSIAVRGVAYLSGSLRSTGSAAVNAETYDYRGLILQRDEAPGGAWDVSKVNAAEFGLEVV